MKLTADDLKKVETKNIANILRKQADGKTLSAAERKALVDAVAGDDAPHVDSSTFACSWDDLANALSIDERSLFNFRKRWAVEIKQRGRTLTRADGRHCIAAWRKFADEVGELKGKGINHPEISYLDERQLRLRERQLAVEKAEHKLAQQKGEILPLIEYQSALRVTLGAFDSALRQIPGRAAERIVQRAREGLIAMLRAGMTEKQFARIQSYLEAAAIDHVGISTILDDEIEACRRTLAEADYLETTGS